MGRSSGGVTAGAPTGAQGRLPNMEVLRGLAALAVLVGHAYALGEGGVPISADRFLDGVVMATATGVWLFFALSGLVITRPFVRALVHADAPDPAPGPYVARRLARIFPLFLVCMAVTLALLGTSGHGPRSMLAHLGLLHNLLPGHQLDFIGVTWTLSVELLFYGLVPVLFLLLRRSRRPVSPAGLTRWVVISAVASVGWMLAGGVLGDASAGLSLYVRMLFPSMWSAFCPGILIAVLEVASPADRDRSVVLRGLHRLRTDPTTAAVVGGSAAALGFAATYAQVEWGTAVYLGLFDLGRVAWSVAFGVLLLQVMDRHALAARTPRALDSLGTWSYGIYLIHGTLLVVLMRYADGALIPMPRGGAIAFVVHLALVLAVTIPLSWLSWRVLEHPAIVAARRVRARRAAPATPRPAEPPLA